MVETSSENLKTQQTQALWNIQNKIRNITSVSSQTQEEKK